MRTRCATELRHSPLRAPRGIAGALVVDCAPVPVAVFACVIGARNINVFIEAELEFGIRTWGPKCLGLLKHPPARPVTVGWNPGCAAYELPAHCQEVTGQRCLNWFPASFAARTCATTSTSVVDSIRTSAPSTSAN